MYSLRWLFHYESFKLKKLNEGQFKRNLLIHRPQYTRITQEDANEYIRDVEIAIYHLLIQLYPEDHFIKYIFKFKLGIIQCSNCGEYLDLIDKECKYCNTKNS